jgi:hypothetical protein
MVELKNRTCGKKGRQVGCFEIDGWQRDPRLHSPLQLQQLDLKIDRGSEVGLLFLQAAKLDDFSRFGPWLMSFRHGRIVLDAEPSLELGKSSFLSNAFKFLGRRGWTAAVGAPVKAGHAKLKVLAARCGP